jgi:hypothetical protein
VGLSDVETMGDDAMNKHGIAIAILLSTGCANLDSVTDSAFKNIQCAELLCDGDEICILGECHLECEHDNDCGNVDSCMPVDDGRAVCIDDAEYIEWARTQ